MLLHSAKDNEGVKYLLGELGREVTRIDDILLTADSYDVPDYQRDRLVDVKKTYKRILSLFDTDAPLQTLQDEINKNI